jgi:hypothetical protein
VFTEIAKARNTEETFEDLLELEKHEAFQKIIREFLYRVNKLYTHPLLGDMLDTGEIDYLVLDALEEFSQVHPRGRL